MVRVAIVAVKAVARGAIVVTRVEGGGGVGDRDEGERAGAGAGAGGPRNAFSPSRV